MPGESPPSRRCWPSRWLILWATYHEVVRTIAARFNAVCTRTHARRPHPIACALTLGRLLSLPLSPSLSLSAARSQCIGTSGGKGQGGSALSSRDEKKAYLKRATCVDSRRIATGSSDRRASAVQATGEPINSKPPPLAHRVHERVPATQPGALDKPAARQGRAESVRLCPQRSERSAAQSRRLGVASVTRV